MQNIPLLTLKPAAIVHFCALLAKHAAENAGEKLNLRISVTNPGSLKADVGISFCPFGDQEDDDIAIQYTDFVLYIAQDSIAALREAEIDFKPVENGLGGQLSVKAPFIRGMAPTQDAPLHERVKYIIDTEINPNLASHGGFVTLVDIVDNNKVVLRFGGGCHGCGMADVTLKNGIEKTLLQQCPDIVAVQDATDHALGENPYFA
jgi:Fe/S biogenesis protein NfuA